MLKYVGIILCVLLLSLSVAFLAVSMIYGDVFFTFVGIGFCIFGAMEMNKETSQLGKNGGRQSSLPYIIGVTNEGL